MTLDDIGRVPVDCQGERAALEARIAELGSAAMLAFDAGRHVGQLQFRKYEPGLRSQAGVFAPDYWGDFEGRRPDLPAETLCLYCYHVGQTAPGKDRDPIYQGRGIGAGLLDALIAWARAAGYVAVVAKAMPASGPVLQYMGGQPERIYKARGFRRIAAWTDLRMHEALVERALAAPDSDPAATSRVGLCLLRL